MDTAWREERVTEMEKNAFGNLNDRLKAEDVELCHWKHAPITVRQLKSRSLHSLIRSDHQLVDGCLRVFATLCLESAELVEKARHNFYNALALYGEEAGQQFDSDGGGVEMMSEFTPLLSELFSFVERCYEVARSTIEQLRRFIALRHRDMPKAAERDMLRVWRSLADLFSIMIVLDELILNNPSLRQHNRVYVKAIQAASHNPAQFAGALADAERQLAPLLATLQRIQSTVIAGRIFRPHSISVQNFCEREQDTLHKGDAAFVERCKRIVMQMLAKWECSTTSGDVPDRHQLLNITALVVFYHWLLPVPRADKKMIRAFHGTHKRLASFYLGVSDIVWTPFAFALKYLPPAICEELDKKLMSAVEQAEAALLEKHLVVLENETNTVDELVQEWRTEMRELVRLRSDASAHPNGVGKAAEELYINNRCTLLVKGAHLADRMNFLSKNVLNGHLHLEKTLSKSNAKRVLRLIELMKSITFLFNTHWTTVLEWCAHASVYWRESARKTLQEVRLSAQRAGADGDVLAVLSIAENVLSGSVTRAHLTVCRVSLEMANYEKWLSSQAITDLDELLNRLESITDIGRILTKVTECSFFYWHRNIVGLYFHSILEDCKENCDIMFFSSALNDCCLLLHSARHCNPSALIDSFRDEILRELEEEFVQKFLLPLCTGVENDLRLIHHSHGEYSAEKLEREIFPGKGDKQGAASGALAEDTAVLTRRELLRLPDIALIERVVNVKEFVVSRLEETFHNLTAVALHDGLTYSKMRLLAKFRYELELWPNRLPSMKIDQGLDALMIVKSLEQFISNFNYDASEKFFVETSSKGRHLHLVGTSQIVNSLNTHGLGLLNTGVHVAYDLLKAKFRVLSRMLLSDQVRSLLIREVRFYRDSVDETIQMYPYPRGEQTRDALKRMNFNLAQAETARTATFLDALREIITEIGNAISFVKLMCTGAAEYYAGAASYIQKEAKGSVLRAEVPRQAGEEDRVPSDYNKSVHDEARGILASTLKSVGSVVNHSHDYVEMLLAAFATEFRNHHKYPHLRSFFILVPPLCIDHAEHMLVSATRFGKRLNNEDTERIVFVNDGFAMGIAYIMTLLNQQFFFDSLKWFESATVKLKEEEANAIEKQKEARRREDQSYAKSIALRLARIEALREEFTSLNNILSSALIFFRAKDQAEDAETAEETFLEEL